MSTQRPRGALIAGIDGLSLDAATAELLRHPAVGGVILFDRNYRDRDQLRSLIESIAALRSPRLLVTVDQEGGRVQRLRAGFTPLPPLAVLGRWYDSHADRARDLAYRHGRVMAAEVLDAGVDLSWAPVLDIGGDSRVIGDRAMAPGADAVADLGAYYIAGMRDAGMACCGKHFPGHGAVAADSHHEVVTDARDRRALERDMAPFARLAGQLDCVMMAHVIYPARAERPAGFSKTWIGECLRGELGFDGLVVSDDLDMAGAAAAGDLDGRLQQAFEAGCDLALVCRPESVRKLLAADPDCPAPDAERMQRLCGRAMMTLTEQLQVPEFRAWRESLGKLAETSK